MKKIVLFVGGSGSGKSYTEKALVKRGDVHKIISITTRDIRLEDGEVDGVDYFYLTEKEFNEREKIESTCFGGNYYGIEKSQLDTSKNIITAVVEPSGLEQLLKTTDGFEKIIIWFNIPEQIRIENMKKRGDDPEKILKRLKFDDIDSRFKKLCEKLSIEADLEITELNETTLTKVLDVVLR